MYKFLFLALGSAFWPTPLVAGTTLFCRDFSGGVPSDLRSPWRVGRPAGADLVGTCAGDGKVEIYDILRPPGANTPSMLRGDDVCSDVMLHFVNVCQQTWCTWDLGEAPFLFFWTRRIACNSRQLGRGLEAWATTAGNTNGDVEAWYMAPKILLGICMGASSTSFLTTTAVMCSRHHQSIDNGQSPIQRPIEKMIFPQKNIFRMRGCVLLLLVAVCLVRAGGPEWNGSRVRIVCPFTPQYVYLLVKKRQLCCCASIRGAGHSGDFLRCCRAPAATTTASTLLRTATTAELSHSLASFNYQAFLKDPLSRSPAKSWRQPRSWKTSAVSVIYFPKLINCQLCVIVWYLDRA